jgi:excisionase family DNA binding protein
VFGYQLVTGKYHKKLIVLASKRGYKECAGLQPEILRFSPASSRNWSVRTPMAPMAQTAPREVMDIRQASEYLGISGDTLYRYASEGFIPAFKLGNRWRFKKSLLDSWMDEKSGVAPQAVAPTTPKQKKPAGRVR